MLRKIFLLATFICLQASLYSQKSLNNAAVGLKDLPILFEENHGQVDSDVRFLAHAGKSAIYFAPNEAVLALYSRDSQRKPAVSALRMQWIGANAHPAASQDGGLLLVRRRWRGRTIL